MSNRSLIEFNHDFCPRNDAECLDLGKALSAYMRAADEEELPSGVRLMHYRHHSDPCPIKDDVAPDLLKALRNLVLVIEADAKPIDTLNAARAAIARATGAQS